LPYHLFSAAGPLNYFATTVYQAGDRDAAGNAPGQQRRNPAGELVWTLPGRGSQELYGEWPAPNALAVLEAGKPRALNSARETACWPEATDAELLVERGELERKLAEALARFDASLQGSGRVVRLCLLTGRFASLFFRARAPRGVLQKFEGETTPLEHKAQRQCG
jgi:hypothetical protein